MCLLGDVRDCAVVLSPIGEITLEEWTRSAALRRELTLDAFVIMPNHIHGIVWIEGATEGEGARKAATAAGLCAPLRLKSERRTLGSFVAGLKAAVTSRVQGELARRGPLWQRSYYDHVIRDDKDLAERRDYVAGNPARWEEDENYPFS
jgi:REP element-mobilizing transposase RayT